jgi:hypothetical protein
MFRQRCGHISQINDVKPSAQGCEECLRTGDTWMHLSECLICRHIGCCDQSVSLSGRNALTFLATLSPIGEVHYSLAA